MKQLATVVAGLAVLVLALATGALAGTPGGPGAVYALTNSAQGNAVAVYDRAADGHLSSPRFYATAGLGSGAGGLGSQGGVALTADGHVLLAVNAGSNTVSAFAVTGSGLQLLDVVPSFGTQPVSIAVQRHVAFVVNATSLSIHGSHSRSSAPTMPVIPTPARAFYGKRATLRNCGTQMSPAFFISAKRKTGSVFMRWSWSRAKRSKPGSAAMGL